MLNKKNILLTLLWLFVIGLIVTGVQAASISIDDPIGTQGSMSAFFDNILSHLLNIIGYIALLFIVMGGIMYVLSGMGGGNENLKKMAQNTLTFAIIGLALAAAGPTFLREVKVVVLGSPTAVMPTDLNAAPTLTAIVTRALTFLLSIIGILAIISLVIGGIMYVFASGSVDVAKRATKTIVYSLLGIVVAGGALIIIQKIAELLR